MAAAATDALSPGARAAPPPWKITTEAGNIMSQVPPEIMNITLRFAGLPRGDIVRIIHNRSKPINLCWFRYIRGLWFETSHNQERIGSEHGDAQALADTGTYK